MLFRYRYWMHVAVYGLGFAVPWDRWVDLDQGRTSWLAMAAWPARNGWMSFSGATIAVLLAGIVCAVLGAWLRTWGTAYLGGGTVQDGRMQGGVVVADGTYRHVRNPLYLGTWVHTLALAMLMPPSGAVFSIVLIGALQGLLIAGEEGFLAARLGAAYAAYRAKVPRLLPAVRVQVAAGGVRGRWGQAFLAEIYFWGVAGSFAVAGWRYNAFLLLKCVVVSFGVALVARAFQGSKAEGAGEPRQAR